ncbi:MAG: polysaccharide deacetylase family protein, partial [Oscillospiraceae bacterium]|nr:polysaccharide deacetylase family protein [Oscillospiraceae bacterium]
DLKWLTENGYTTVLPRELSAGKLDDGSELPEKMVMLTFDDGYESNLTVVLPLLEKYGAKAVVGLITSRIGEGNGFLNWEQCREMAESGLIEFGSHTHDHHIRPEAEGIVRIEGETQESYTTRIGNDLSKSVELIESEIGTPVTYFAHPLGKTDEWATDILTELFSVTVTSDTAKADLSKGLYLLPRYNVTESQRAEHFINKLF